VTSWSDGSPGGASAWPWALGIAASSVCVGLALTFATRWVFAFCALVAYVALSSSRHRWIALGLIPVVAANAVPLYRFGTTERLSGLLGSDVAMAMAAVVLTVAYLNDREDLLGRFSACPRTVWAVGAVFVAYWGFVVFRTWLLDGVPLPMSVLYGRQFLALPLCAAAMVAGIDEPKTASRALGVVLVFSLIYAVAYIARVFGVNTEAVVHSLTIRTSDSGLPRVYSEGTQLVNLGVVVAAALSFFGGRSPLRALGLLALPFTASAVAMQMSRGNMLALALGVLAVLGVWALRRQRNSGDTMSPVAVVAVVLVTAFVGWGLTFLASVFGMASGRLQTAVVEIASGTGNYGYRVDLVQTMETVLSGHWLAGLGFLHPSVRYVNGLPNGSIINSDLGAMAIVMTMGAIGAGMLAFLCVAGILVPLRNRMTDWTGISSAAFLAAAVIGAATLLPSPAILGFAVGVSLGACASRLGTVVHEE
jgi:hypothetical protein